MNHYYLWIFLALMAALIGVAAWDWFRVFKMDKSKLDGPDRLGKDG